MVNFHKLLHGLFTTKLISSNLSLFGFSEIKTNLKLLAEDGLTVHGVLSGIGILLPLEGDEGVALAGVVHVSHHAELVKLTLDLLIGEILVDTVHEQLGHLV